MIDLGSLKIGVTADTEQANKNLDATSEKTSKLSKVGEATKTGFKAVGKTMVALGTATAGAGAAMFGMATKTAQSQDRVDKMSQSLGMSKKGFQEWDYILSQNGTSIDSMGTAMKTLTSDSKSTKEAFSKLGLNITDSMSKEEVFEKTVKSLQGMKDGTEKAKLAQQLFGKQSQSLMPLLNGEAGSVDELRKKANDLGMVMSDKAISGGVAFSDSLDTLKRSSSGLANNMMSKLMPSFTGIMDGLTGLISGADGAEEKVLGGVQDIIDKIIEMLPKIIDTGSSLILSLVDGIVEKLPDLMDKIMEIIPDIVTKLIEMLPKIIESGVKILTSLINGITKALPKLIPKAIEIIVTIANTLLKNIDKIIEGGVKLIIALAKGLIKAKPQLIEKVPAIITNLINAITRNLPFLLNSGVELVIEIGKGLIKAIPQLIKNIPAIIKAIVSGLISCFGSILKVGGDIIKKLWDGIKSMGKWLGDKFGDFFKPIFEKVVDIAKVPLKGIQGLLNGLISGLNVLINGANKIRFDVPDWVPVIGGKKFGFNLSPIPSINWFKDGGIMDKATMFGMNGVHPMIGGEAGTEAIIPLKKLPQLMKQMGMIPSNGTIKTSINIDGREVAIATSPYISEELAF